MSIRAKPFQQATIDAALRTLMDRRGPRRFLVADEVGLGKTVVASGVIECMQSRKRKKPLCVLYVCSNLTIARQNMSRLLSFLPPEQHANAIGNIDRPSLMPIQKRPDHRLVHVFQLTPGTAIPTRKGQRRDGRMEERALALVLISQIAPTVSKCNLFKAFKGNVGESFISRVKEFENEAKKRNGLGGVEFRLRFRDVLRDLLDVVEGAHLPPRLHQMLDDNGRHRDLVGFARTALAIASLHTIAPDVVILDEFQRFRDLTEDDDCEDTGAVENDDGRVRKRAAARVMNAIRGDGGPESPALLLLSATPYALYRSRQKADTEHADFSDLLAFLAKTHRVADESKQLFQELREELQKGEIHSERAKEVRLGLTTLLKPLMSRTERTSVRLNGVQQPSTGQLVSEPLNSADLRPFLRMQECFRKSDRACIVPLWQSVPLPLQTLGSRYLAWRRKQSLPATAELSKQQRDSYDACTSWPHPRLRALMNATTKPVQSMPWLRPSLPWWPLAGKWKQQSSEHDDKLLVFSRYRAVPTALSGLLSYATECRLIKGMRGRSKLADYETPRRDWLGASGAMIELFHPSPFLADLEPLRAGQGSLANVHTCLIEQLRKKMEDINVRVVKSKKSQRKPWQLLAALERKSGHWEQSKSAWRDIVSADDGGRLAKVLDRWEKASSNECVEVSSAELKKLARLALEAPGVVLLRALQRHWSTASCGDSLSKVVEVAWHGLRSYFNKPWFVSALSTPKSKTYPVALRGAVVEGGFESVLDEHFWYVSKGSDAGLQSALNELGEALRLRDTNVTFHEATNDGNDREQLFRLRCHVAVPLTEGRVRGLATQADDEPLRPDEVRKAFNSPFWPRVLVTTSVGQEGLDLHPWCDALAHWDLANGPVALEQREGRITRFASLAVRRAIARKLGEQLRAHVDGKSPWIRLAELADSQLADPSGLSPWWVLDGAACKTYVYSATGSEQKQRYEALNQERALYRLVLGVPDQEDLIGVLKDRLSGDDPIKLRDAFLDLCAYNLATDDTLEAARTEPERNR